MSRTEEEASEEEEGKGDGHGQEEGDDADEDEEDETDVRNEDQRDMWVMDLNHPSSRSPNFFRFVFSSSWNVTPASRRPIPLRERARACVSVSVCVCVSVSFYAVFLLLDSACLDVISVAMSKPPPSTARANKPNK